MTVQWLNFPACFQCRERIRECHEVQVGEDYYLLLAGGNGTT